MANIRLTPQQMTDVGVAPTYNAGLTTTDTYVIANDGRTFLHCKKTGAGACTVTINTPNTISGLAIADRTVTVAATTGDVMIGPFPAGTYNQPGTQDAYITFSEVTGLTMAVVRI